MIEPLALTQFEFFVHLDRLKWTYLDANLAAHADRDVDVEDLRVKLRFAHVIGLFVLALNDVNALRRTFLLANFARHAAQPRMRIVAVVNQERKIPIIFRKRTTLLRVLHCGQAFLLEITSDKVPCRDGHSLEYACANHRFAKVESLIVRSSILRNIGMALVLTSDLRIIDPLLPLRYRYCRGLPLHQ